MLKQHLTLTSFLASDCWLLAHGALPLHLCAPALQTLCPALLLHLLSFRRHASNFFFLTYINKNIFGKEMK